MRRPIALRTVFEWMLDPVGKGIPTYFQCGADLPMPPPCRRAPAWSTMVGRWFGWNDV
jgi:hypothetical protein